MVVHGRTLARNRVYHSLCQNEEKHMRAVFKDITTADLGSRTMLNKGKPDSQRLKTISWLN